MDKLCTFTEYWPAVNMNKLQLRNNTDASKHANQDARQKAHMPCDSIRINSTVRGFSSAGWRLPLEEAATGRGQVQLCSASLSCTLVAGIHSVYFSKTDYPEIATSANPTPQEQLVNPVLHTYSLWPQLSTPSMTSIFPNTAQSPRVPVPGSRGMGLLFSSDR